MSGMRDFIQNADRGMHKEAQAKQVAAMAKMAERCEKVGIANTKGLHIQAKNWLGPEKEKVSTLEWFTAEAMEAGIGPSDTELKAAESYWLKKLKVRDFETVREEKVRDHALHRWMIDRVMEDQGLEMRGRQASPVAKAFMTNTTQVIFPFFYDSAIQAGILASPILDRLIMQDVPVNSHTADHAMMTDTAGGRKFTEGGEGTTATMVTIMASNRPITLHKFLGKARISYEAARLQRLPIFEKGLMRVGQQFQIQITDRGVETLVSGDGNANTAATAVAAVAASSPVYSDHIKLHTDFTMGYEDEDGFWLMPIEQIRKTLNMGEYKDPFAGFNYQRTGQMVTPLGMDILRWDVTGDAVNWAATNIMEVKPGLAMIKYTEGGLLTETDKIIDGGWDDTVFSTWTGFGIFDAAARRLGTSY